MDFGLFRKTATGGGFCIVCLWTTAAFIRCPFFKKIQIRSAPRTHWIPFPPNFFPHLISACYPRSTFTQWLVFSVTVCCTLLMETRPEYLSVWVIFGNIKMSKARDREKFVGTCGGLWGIRELEGIAIIGWFTTLFGSVRPFIFSRWIQGPQKKKKKNKLITKIKKKKDYVPIDIFII